MLPPLFAHKQGVSEDLWRCGSKYKVSKMLTRMAWKHEKEKGDKHLIGIYLLACLVVDRGIEPLCQD